MRRIGTVALLAGGMMTAAMAQGETVRLFISGHSLTDRPMPDMVAAMAEHAGFQMEWNRQHIGGSTIRMRTAGEDANAPGSGYRAGEDRDGGAVDVLAAAADYDIFVITERHRVLDVLLREGALRHLRDFVSRVSSANPNATTYFYAPWADVSDLGKPGAWIEYERRASPIWHCIVERANELDEGMRPISFIPASEALAELIAALNQNGGSQAEDEAGFSGLSPGEISALLFTDKVHLTDLGVYYVALITYGIVFGDLSNAEAEENLVSAAWISPDLDPDRARTLRRIAGEFLDSWKARESRGNACGTVPAGFILNYTDYMQEAYGNAELGVFRATIRRLRQTLSFLWDLHGWGSNPLAEDRAS